MGTFGTGPFSSDGALDFVDRILERPLGDRVETLRSTLAHAVAHPDLLWREYFPDELVAAAALVASTFPGGEGLLHRLAEVSDEPVLVVLPEPVSDLAGPAWEALQLVAGPDGPWHQGWTTEADRAEAQETTDGLAAILVAATLRAAANSQDRRAPADNVVPGR